MEAKALKQLFSSAVVVWVTAILVACGPTRHAAGTAHDPENLKPVSLGAEEKLKVVATTNIVGDVVGRVGGDLIDLATLMGVGGDPHSYIATPADTAAIHDADVVFANGAGLEEFLDEMLDQAGGSAIVVHVSDGLDLLTSEGYPEQEAKEADHKNEGSDPHVWFNVQNVRHWTDVIGASLISLDPANAETYTTNATAYDKELGELDRWIVEMVASIPEPRRMLVTNHPTFGYLADRYGLEQVGVVYPVSPSAEPSAKEIAALEDAIRNRQVEALFTEETVSAKLAEQVALDTGVQVVALYTGSVGGPGSGAESYVDLMRYNVSAIVMALK